MNGRIVSAAGKNILYPRKYLLVSNCNIAKFYFDSSVINVLMSKSGFVFVQV